MGVIEEIFNDWDELEICDEECNHKWVLITMGSYSKRTHDCYRCTLCNENDNRKVNKWEK